MMERRGEDTRRQAQRCADLGGGPAVLDLEVALGLATFAGATASIAAEDATCLGRDGEALHSARLLEAGWNLAAFTRGGEWLMRLLEIDEARIELVPDVALERQGGTLAARIGSRTRAMGSMRLADGSEVQLSCRLVLRLPHSLLRDPRSIALALVHHAAHHALERAQLPCDGRTFDVFARIWGASPPTNAAAGAWVDRVCADVARDLGTDPDGPLAPWSVADALCALVSATYAKGAARS